MSFGINRLEVGRGKLDRKPIFSPFAENGTSRGKYERLVPLFPELRSELKRHFLPDNEFVIQGCRGKHWALGTSFQKIADRAGLETVVRPFDNMRMSRSNEVEQRWGAKLESLWIGHSVKTMQKHYANVSDEDFAKAAK